MLVHGGMAQNVGPILEMVTEKYLLRSRGGMAGAAGGAGNSGRNPGRVARARMCVRIGAATSRNFHGPIQTIIPWAGNFYTETLIDNVRGRIRRGFLGILDAGRDVRRRHGVHLRAGPQGRGAGTLAGDHVANQARPGNALPFAMEPVVYDFAINERGTWADLLTGGDALLPPHYYTLDVPHLLRSRSAALCRLCAAPSWTNSPLPAAPSPNWAAWCRISSTACCRNCKANAPAAAKPGGLAGRKWLRPRPARTNPRRSQGRADRPCPKPPARQRHHRRRPDAAM